MIQQTEMDGRPSFGQYLSALLLCAFIVASAFLFISDLNQQPKAKLDTLIEGTAERPYVSRRLVPLLLGVVAPTQADDAPLPSATTQPAPALDGLLAWLALPSHYGGVLVVFFGLNFLFLVGFGLAFRRLALHLDIPHPARLSLVALLLLLLPAFLSHGYIYDYSTLLLWTLLLLTFAEGRWRWLFVVIVLAAVNKETALLIPLIWLTYGWTLGRARFYWGMLFAQSAVVVAIWGLITWLFRDNGGGLFEFNWSVHIAAYQNEPFAIAAVAFFSFALLAIALPVAPPLLRSSALLLAPLAGLYLFFGWPYEFRVFYEVYPTLVMLGALAIRRISRRSSLAVQFDTTPAPGTAAWQSFGALVGASQFLRIAVLATLLIAWFLRVWRLYELPPGLMAAEAFNGIDAAAIAARQHFSLFFEANHGREPLFIYLQSLFVELIDVSAYSLRLASAMVGTLTIAAVFTLARTLLAGAAATNSPTPASNDTAPKPLRSALFAAFGAASIALSYWHVSLSRLGLQAILTPLLCALAGYFFWRAWHDGRKREWLLAGAWIGLALYADATARFFPAVLAAFILMEGLFGARQVRLPSARQRLLGIGLMTTMALLVFAPLGVQFVQSPAPMTDNIAELSVFTAAYATMPGAPRERLGQNLTDLLRAFYVKGDDDLCYNLPGLPLHNLLLAIVFTVGFAVAVWRMDRPAYRLAALWLAIMALPTWLTVHAPDTLQMSGIIPPLAVLYGIGAAELVQLRLPLLRSERAVGSALVTMLVAGVVLTGGATVLNYFVRWPGTPGLAEAFGQNQYWAAEYVRAQLRTQDERRLLLSESLFQSPAMRLLLSEIQAEPACAAQPVQPAQPSGGQFLLDPPSASSDQLFLITQEKGLASVARYGATDSAGRPLIDDLQQKGDRVQTDAPAPSAHPIVMGELPEDLVLTPALIPYSLTVTFENGLELVGYAPPVDSICPAPGESITLSTYWRRLPSYSPAWHGSSIFAHLMLPESQVQTNGPLRADYPPDLWRPGEVVQVQRDFWVESARLDGKAFFEIGLYRRDLTGAYQRHAILDGAGQPAGDQVNLAPFFFCADPPVVETADLPALGVFFEERIELIGIDSQPADEDHLRVRLVWRAVDRSHTDYVVFVHLIDQGNQIISQTDQPPGGMDNQTSMWAPGEMTSSQVDLTLPANSDLNLYRLRIGLYEPVSGRQLVISAPGEVQGQSYVITLAHQY